jgi:hypothetical protein
LKEDNSLASLRFTEGADGTLTPVSIELVPGDLFRLQSGDSTSESALVYAPTGAFILTGVSTGEDGSITLIDGSGASAPVRALPSPDPTLPAPPPEDGASKRSHDSSANIITIVIDKT